MSRASRSSWVVRGFAVIGGAAVLLLVGSALLGPGGVVRHERLRDELERVEQLNEELRQKNADLARRAHGLRHDRPFLEATVKDELGWVRDDEMVVIFEEEPRPAP